MIIHLPADLESSIHAAVASGHFASVDEAMAEAVRRLLRDRTPIDPSGGPAGETVDHLLGSIGAMSDAADELDEIVADAYRRRREETWRELAVE